MAADPFPLTAAIPLRPVASCAAINGNQANDAAKPATDPGLLHTQFETDRQSGQNRHLLARHQNWNVDRGTACLLHRLRSFHIAARNQNISSKLIRLREIGRVAGRNGKHKRARRLAIESLLLGRRDGTVFRELYVDSRNAAEVLLRRTHGRERRTIRTERFRCQQAVGQGYIFVAAIPVERIPVNAGLGHVPTRFRVEIDCNELSLSGRSSNRTPLGSSTAAT